MARIVIADRRDFDVTGAPFEGEKSRATLRQPVGYWSDIQSDWIGWRHHDPLELSSSGVRAKPAAVALPPPEKIEKHGGHVIQYR